MMVMTLFYNIVFLSLFDFRLFPEKLPVTNIQHYAAPGRISYEEAIRGTFTDAAVGHSFGPT